MLRWPNKAVHFHRPRVPLSCLLARPRNFISSAGPSNDKRFMRSTRDRPDPRHSFAPSLFVHVCDSVLSLSLSLPYSVSRGSTEQSTIAVLRGSGNVSEGTLRKLNPFIFSMFTVVELLFSHDNDRTSNGESNGRKLKMHQSLHQYIDYAHKRNIFTNDISK